MRHRPVIGPLVALVATAAATCALIPSASASTATAKPAKFKSACSLLTTSEVSKVMGVPATGKADDPQGTNATQCSWITTATGDANTAIGVADGSGILGALLLRGQTAKGQFEQASVGNATTPVAGLGKAAKYGEGIGLVLLVDANTVIDIGAAGKDLPSAQAASEALAKLAIARLQGRLKPAPSTPA